MRRDDAPVVRKMLHLLVSAALGDFAQRDRRSVASAARAEESEDRVAVVDGDILVVKGGNRQSNRRAGDMELRERGIDADSNVP